ncbi:MAG: hypothetical protein APF84_01215 [Gracilibacter sp. BRH_c7a]|nr:MAG: hypothetical protein APF84_01215 [Gracilibacter sp. BRH_c7a]
MLKRKLILIIGVAILGITLVALPSIAATTTNEENEINKPNGIQDYMNGFNFEDHNEFMNSSAMLEMHNSEVMQEMHNSPEMLEAMNAQDFEEMQDIMDSYSAETGETFCH